MAQLGAGTSPEEVTRFVEALFEHAPREAFVEVRFRRSCGMGQSFHRAGALEALSREIAAHARQRDVYVGVIPRNRRGGARKDLVTEGTVAWVDCDDEASVAALSGFRPAPTIIVASGSATNCHAYWRLDSPTSVDVIEQLNRRLARRIGADGRSSEAARILRPAGTTNWKGDLPARVRLLQLERSPIGIDELVADLPPLEGPRRSAGRRPISTPREGADDLTRIPPAEYVECLTGREVGRDHKVACPFHDDHTPSLHVYDEPERGWYCFGCGRGGTIYDFAALLWKRGLRGSEFVRVRQELLVRFGSLGSADRPQPARRGVGRSASPPHP